MCDIAEGCFFLSCFSIIINFGSPFVVTACTHSNMSLKSGGEAASVPPIPPYTLALQWSRNQFCIGGAKVYWEGWTKTRLYIIMSNKINKDRIHTFKIYTGYNQLVNCT